MNIPSSRGASSIKYMIKQAFIEHNLHGSMTSSSPIANFEEDLTDRQVIRPILKHMN
jgi:hypothetical protein